MFCLRPMRGSSDRGLGLASSPSSLVASRKSPAVFADRARTPQEDMWRKFLAWDMTRPGEKPYKMAIFMILQFFRGSLPLKARLVREAMFKDGLHLLKSIFEMPFPFD